jgi:hypothetical protein
MLMKQVAGKNWTRERYVLRSRLLLGGFAALLPALPSILVAQTWPLTVQHSTARVGVGTTVSERSWARRVQRKGNWEIPRSNSPSCNRSSNLAGVLHP